MLSRFLARFVLTISLCMLISGSALAQYGGGGGTGGTTGGTTTTTKGYGSSTGIAIGAGAAAAVGIAYFALRNRGTVVGCVEAAEDATSLVNEKDKRTYALVAGNGGALPAGRRVELKGKKSKDQSGRLTFRVTKVARVHGSC